MAHDDRRRTKSESWTIFFVENLGDDDHNTKEDNDDDDGQDYDLRAVALQLKLNEAQIDF